MTSHLRAPASWLVALTLAMSVLSGCASSSSSSSSSSINGVPCNDADKAVVSDIMDTARTKFLTGDTITDHFEFKKAVTAPIPESKRKYGAAELMVLLVSVYLEDDDAKSGLSGIQGPVYVVLDDDGQPLGPLGTLSQPFFNITPPADPGWTPWADRLERSDFAADLFGCVNPSRR
jgi:hypothetical protein